MSAPQLWDKISQNPSDSFIADVKEGKVPELPYFIVDQTDAKSKIKAKIDTIKDERFQTSIVTANYGNGKTNILKYLSLYYRNHKNINVLYYRADADNYDIILNLLRILEDNYTNYIIESVKKLVDENFDYASLANNYSDNFSAIEEYTKKLFSFNEVTEIRNIFYLGTGRLNSKRYFDKQDLRQLKDYERREILVLFLNILSHTGRYVIFCIDEVEKIREKSKARFSHFLTSLRELIDLSNKVKGHYLILALTDGVDSNLIQSTNEPLYQRIGQHIIAINPITEKKDKEDLINYLKELFNSDEDTNEVQKKLSKETDATSNRLLIQRISDILFGKTEKKSLEKALKDNSLFEIFNETKKDLDVNVNAFKNIHRKFFDPLEYYLDSFNIKIEEFTSQLRYYYNYETDTFCYFVFSKDISVIDNEMLKIKSSIEYLNFDKKTFFKNISIFVPASMELNYSYLDKYEFLKDYKLNIIDVQDFEELFTLLELYRQNFEYQPKLKPIIENYTNSSL
ncbi:hypothetical protein EIH07_05355 [Chryseobacterium taklimakanense]|uniref:hypothetical protein n=1 Tax=Chryseobacterium taklimakanense TaxID=536441 RepID=UPI000F5D9289|nr:hypothetical protein [Chryseobacterium taklimakanense]AZI22510.1 hypothetical protein EIH07_05355 [Chryseobacterium taklimakanense]